MINTACMYLSEALSKHLLSSYPRLHSLRSFSLGLLRNSLSEAINHCCAWRMGINPTPTLANVACSQGCARWFSFSRKAAKDAKKCRSLGEEVQANAIRLQGAAR